MRSKKMEENIREEKEHQDGIAGIGLQGRTMRIRTSNKEEFIAEVPRLSQGDW